MKKDKAIEEIRAVRQKISEEYGHDITAFLDHHRELERQYKDRLVTTRKTGLSLLEEQTTTDEGDGVA